jgi:LysR family transcriptional regulator of gallate degradation
MNNITLEDRAAAISFRQLKLFESVGRLESVRRGSEECNLSQPAVTQALAKLEHEIGVAVLERRASGSYLTDAGKILHLRVTRMFTLIEDALLELGVPGGTAGAQSIANRITRSQIRSLLSIIESGSFLRAAQSLDLTQASLQRAARDLESNLRKAIYYRTAAGVMVTPAGIEFGRKIKLATQEIEWGITEIEAAMGSCDSKIVIGALPFGGSMLLASVLADFVAANPQADVRIINEGASEMRKRLRAGDVDLVIGLMQETTAADLTNEFLAETPYEIVARRGHPLTRKGKVTLDDLSHYDWVVGTEGASRRTCFDTLFAGRPMPKAPIATCVLPVIRHLLACSDRLTLMTSYELMHEGGTLSAVLFGKLPPNPAIGITMRANWLPTQLHRDFIDLLRAQVTTATAKPILQQAI